MSTMSQGLTQASTTILNLWWVTHSPTKYPYYGVAGLLLRYIFEEWQERVATEHEWLNHLEWELETINIHTYMTDGFEVCERSSSSSTEIEDSKVPPP